MSITKAIEIAKVEVLNTWIVQVASDIVISENNAEISRSRHRTVLLPYITTLTICNPPIQASTITGKNHTRIRSKN